MKTHSPEAFKKLIMKPGTTIQEEVAKMWTGEEAGEVPPAYNVFVRPSGSENHALLFL
jgi:hypothetical protein